MKQDSELKNATDYSKGMIDAAYVVLGEIVNLLGQYEDNIRIVGGWVPMLLFPDSGHIGSIDVDILINQNQIKKAESYENIKTILLRNGYFKHPQKFFTFVKTIEINKVKYDVDVDFLSGKYGGDEGNRSKHVDGIKTLPATGGNFAFDFPPEEVVINYQRSDGAFDTGHVKVTSIIPYLVMKTSALGRGKTKDAYDIYHCIKHYEGGVKKLVEEMLPFKDKELIKKMIIKLGEKFASVNHSGPVDIVNFRGDTNIESINQIKQDVYQRINYIINHMK